MPHDVNGVAFPRKSDGDFMPQKVRELVAELERAGFVNRGGKGSHQNFVHPKVPKPITISGALGDDAMHYQVRAVKRAVEESKS
jgi:predicted RNA binding protein YcfA (HicA-like mRNA interferase family)